MHIVLVYRCYNDGTICYNLTFCTEKSLMTDLSSMKKLITPLPFGEGQGVDSFFFCYYCLVMLSLTVDLMNCHLLFIFIGKQ